ncbi:LacI family DNA-binding transcriptional regulator [Marisediminicola senii]|uniref:LacI family DNA-binding transcriptional regulator n=1 Tax=Marisediminicola senii TaxID=2711233 RepID=UPI0013EB6A11|nr:LacI family DNA-binding transcriptional regulator [Marisediminicola senii]
MEPTRVRAPSIRDVARLAGVSYQTVSRVLNDSPSIKPSTRQRVLQVIDEIGYRPNQAARALVTSKSRTIGVLTSTTAHYGPTTSLRAIEDAARAAGYVVSTTSMVTGDPGSVTESLEHLMAQAVEGIVVIAPQVRVFDAFRELALTVPLVTLDSTAADSPRSMAVDQVAGARLATRHLIELGHEEIIHLAGPRDWIEAEARMHGFLVEVRDADLRTHPPILGDWTADTGYRVGHELLGYRDFTAVFAANDQMALGLIHAFLEAGLDVPGDVSVAGFDDIPEASHYWPPLTTVRQDFAELGRRAVALLLSQLEGTTEVDHRQVTPELVLRSSTAPPR